MKRLSFITATLFLGVAIPCLYGQDTTTPAGRIIPDREPFTPRLVISKPGKEQPVSISKAEIEARLNGILAETTVTLTFRNPNGRVLEGELYYPLPEGATLQGYALDINGNLVDGVPVPKVKARIVFEEEQRKNVDPGLVEWTGGNSFKTRIYPIPAQGTRTVRLRYTSILPIGDKGTPIYQLPLNFPQKLDSFRLRIESLDNRKPTLTQSSLSNLEFRDWQGAFLAESAWNNLSMTEDLVISLPAEQSEELKNGGMKSGLESCDGKTFAVVSMVLPHPDNGQVTLPSPDSVDIVWDASGSMVRADTDKTLELLKQYFKQTADKEKEIRVFLLRNKLLPPVSFTVSNGNTDELLQYLQGIRYDGGTGSCDDFLKAPTKAGIRFWVTDGIGNLTAGSSSNSLSVPTYALVAKSEADTNALKRRNVQVLNLTAESIGQALESMKYPLLEATVLGNRQSWKESAFNRQGFRYGDSLVWTAILPDGHHELKFDIRAPDGKTVSSGMVTFDTAQAKPGTMIRSFHGQNMLAKLLLEPPVPATQEALSQLGQDYGIVTPGTSLLVLESLEQYLSHNVRPPASAPKERQLYDKAVAKQHVQNNLQTEQLRLNNLKATLKDWKELTTWYTREFPSSPPKKTDDNNQKTAAITGAGDLVTGDMPSGNASIELNDPQPAPEHRDASSSARGRLLRDVDSTWGSPEADPFADKVSVPQNGIDEENADPFSESSVSLKKQRAQSTAATAPAINIKPWNPDSPYLAALDSSEKPLETYLKLKENQGSSLGFYLDCADWFAKKGDRETAIQILTNLAELELENRSLMRVLAYKLRYLDDLASARDVFEKVRILFPEEPQSYRDLALVLDEMGDSQGAFDILKLVLEQPIHARFRGVEQIVLLEINRIITRAQTDGKPIDTKGLDQAFINPFSLDIRVVINWDTDNSDMDLWATDRFGEKCFYDNNRTSTGGHLSRDVTAGYGPEEFMIRKALSGNYKIEANYYGSQSQKMLTPVTLYAEVYTDYGRPEEKRQTLVFRLNDKNNVVHIGDISYSRENGASISETRDYQIKKGDTLESIAERELGDKSRVKDIVTLNGWQQASLPGTGSIIKLPAR